MKKIIFSCLPLFLILVTVPLFMGNSETTITSPVAPKILFSPYGEFCDPPGGITEIDMDYNCKVILEKWGKLGCTDFKECIFKINENGTDYYGWNWNLTKTGCEQKYVLGMPHILYGWAPWSDNYPEDKLKLPEKFKNITGINVSYDAIIDPQPIFNNKYNFVFECWLTDKKKGDCSNIKYEIMIWETWDNVVPEGWLLGIIDFVQINGEYYFLLSSPATNKCKGKDKDWTFINFWPLIKQPTSNRTINLYPFFKILLDKNIISDNDYLACIMLGNEIGTPINNNRYACSTKFSYFIPSIIANGNVPPNPPSNPTPANSSTNQPIENLNLSWTCSDPNPTDLITYDVFFGENNPPSYPPVSQDQSTTSFTVPDTLSYNKTYYWKIVAKDNHDNVTDGPIWSFTTQNNMPSGLVAYYPFDDGTAYDESGYGNHGTLHNVISTTDRFGNPGKAFFFNGSSSYIDVPGHTKLPQGSSPRTVSAWVKSAPYYSDNQVIFDWGQPILRKRFCALIYKVGNVDFFSSYADDITGDKNIGNNIWHNIVCTYDGVKVKMYVDGQFDADSTKPLNTVGNNLSIGRRGIGDSYIEYFKGCIDDIRIYDRALSGEEISQLYGINNYNLVAYYPFNGNAMDESGNGNNGTVHGATLTSDRFNNPNKAYYFNGTNNYIKVNHNNILNFGANTDFSINCWIKCLTQNFPNNWFIGLVDKSEVGINVKGYQLGILNYQIDEEIFTSAGYIMGYHGNTYLNDNNWHFLSLVAKRSSNNIKMYVDANIDLNFSHSYLNYTLDNTWPLYIGVDRLLERYFKGTIDEVRIYNRALTDSEIQQLYGEGDNMNPLSINNEPMKFQLYSNFPNPFNPTTSIKFDIPKNSFVKLKIYDLLGREISTLVNEPMNSGTYSIDWNAGTYPSGVYFYRIETEDFTDTKRMVLVK